METKMQLSKGIYCDHTKISDKHYFGGYLNLAQNNIDAVFHAFVQRFSLKEGNSGVSEMINNHFRDKLSQPDYQNRIDFLKQYFPVIYYLDLPITDDIFKEYKNESKEKERRAYFRKHFLLLVKTINDLRNFYTHHFHNRIELTEDFYTLLDVLFLKVVEQVRKHKMKDDKTRHLLKKELYDELAELVRSKKEKLEKDNAEGKRINLSEESIMNGVLNDAFYHLLYESGVNKNYQAKYIGDAETENKITLSQSGLLFLLGMFLSKKESEDLRSRVRTFKGRVIKDGNRPIDRNNNSLKYMATHWVFGYLGFKGLKHRLTTHFSKETLLIQIIDELSKVPNEVYQVFTKKQQEEFIEDINEYFKEGDETLTFEENKVIHPVIRKRYEDKFNYFVLRYLDEFVEFPSLRFQIHLGNYVHDRRTKLIEGIGFETERLIKEKIKVFGRLSQSSNLKTDYFVFENQTSDNGWEIFPNPSYNFVSNNIPVFINLQTSKATGARELFGKLRRIKSEIGKSNKVRRESKASKEQIVNLIDKNVKDGKFKDVYIGEPTGVLSLNELPALLYQLLIKKQTPEEIENTLVEKLVERFNVISDYKPGDAIPT